MKWFFRWLTRDPPDSPLAALKAMLVVGGVAAMFFIVP